jgi:hypothetical protein
MSLPKKAIGKLASILYSEKSFWNKEQKRLFAIPIKERTKYDLKRIETCKCSILYLDGKIWTVETIIKPDEYMRKALLTT